MKVSPPLQNLDSQGWESCRMRKPFSKGRLFHKGYKGSFSCPLAPLPATFFSPFLKVLFRHWMPPLYIIMGSWIQGIHSRGCPVSPLTLNPIPVALSCPQYTSQESYTFPYLDISGQGAKIQKRTLEEMVAITAKIREKNYTLKMVCGWGWGQKQLEAA